MGERYLITGVQLGMLKALNKEQSQEFIDDVIAKQFIFNSEDSITADTKYVAEAILGTALTKGGDA